MTNLALAGLLWPMVVLLACVTAPVRAFEALPLARWQVETKPGDTVGLRDAQGTLALDLDLDVKDTILHGHVTFNQATARLLLKQPIKLAPDQRRVIFEACGIDKKPEKESFLQLLPLIRDAEGEVLRYECYPAPHLLHGTTRWGTWCTRYLYGAEAGGATQNIFLADGNGNAWPDGELTFLGFQVEIRPNAFGRQRHTLYLGDIHFGGMDMPYQHPFAYADALAQEPGEYRLAAEVAPSFQAPPIRQVATTFAYDPASQADRRRKISVPLGPDGCYWVRYQITNAAGRVVVGQTLRQNVVANPDPARPTAPALTEPPLLGYLRVNTERHVGGVYALGEPLAVDVRLFAKGAGALQLGWQLLPYGYPTVLEQGDQTVEFAAGRAFQDLVLKPQGDPQRDAYRLKLEVKRDGKVVDQQDYVLGRRTDFTTARSSRQGLVRGREYVKQAGYFRTTFAAEGLGKSEDDRVGQFVRYLDDASKIAPYVTYMIDLADFEILPGVYDFAVLDRVMDAAADRGCAVTVRTAHVDQMATFRWLPYSRQLSYDGTEIVQHYYGCYSGVDPVFLNVWKRANRALYDRYRTHPGFQGYYLMMPGGEWAVMADKPWLGVVAGYEPPARQAFVNWLQQVAGLTLDQANARWGTGFKSWAEVTPPKPRFETGTKPDTRVQWLDFCRFKEYVNTNYWYLELSRDIRSYDRDRVVIIYAPPTIKGLEDLADYTHGGGVPSMPGVGEGESAWLQHKLGAIQESHHPHRWNSYGDPKSMGWVLDWCLYTMVSASGGGGANLHIYYFPQQPLPAAYGQEHGYDRYEKFKPIYNELQGAQLVGMQGRQVATLQDPTSIYCKHRTNFFFRLPDLGRWFELLTYAGVAAEPVAKERLANYKLVLPNLIDEVVAKDTIDLLAGYVRGGGKTVISAVNGRYCPELGDQSFPLLRRLGIQPPAVPFVQTGLDVKATAAAGNPFWAAGEPIRFFTTQNLHEDPQRDEALRKNFFRWPYRWIPQTDYFGWYRGHEVKDGQVLAIFNQGGTAVSRHQVGRGEVVVFWGVPDYKPELMTEFMRKATAWAGVTDPTAGNPVPLMFELRNPSLKRHYAVLWQEQPGEYGQKLSHVPDGSWWVDELVADEKLGTWTGAELRAGKLPLSFRAGQSPLKVLRLSAPTAGWMKKYRQP